MPLRASAVYWTVHTIMTKLYGWNFKVCLYMDVEARSEFSRWRCCLLFWLFVQNLIFKFFLSQTLTRVKGLIIPVIQWTWHTFFFNLQNLTFNDVEISRKPTPGIKTRLQGLDNWSEKWTFVKLEDNLGFRYWFSIATKIEEWKLILQ